LLDAGTARQKTAIDKFELTVDQVKRPVINLRRHLPLKTTKECSNLVGFGPLQAVANPPDWFPFRSGLSSPAWR
jgi:hypothetical protein